MPERNLVTRTDAPGLWQLTTVLCLTISLQLGCSKIGSNNIRDLVSQQPEISAWRESENQSLEEQFLQDPDSFETLSAETAVEQGDAEFVSNENEPNDQNSDATYEDKPIRLTATPPQLPDDPTDACESGRCTNSCCHKGTAIPKLPFAEPIEPPPTAAGPQTPAEPPQEITSQPLTPIVLKSSMVDESIPAQNSLRRAAKFNKDAERGPNPLSVTVPMESPASQSVNNPIRIGNLNHNTNLRAIDTQEPPELIVASISTESLRRSEPESIPPFADCPPPDQPIVADLESSETAHNRETPFAHQANLKNEFSVSNEPTTVIQSTTALDTRASSIRVEDMTDDEFRDEFGMPGVAVKQGLKHLLKRNNVCGACGQFDCTGCFAPDSSPVIEEGTEILKAAADQTSPDFVGQSKSQPLTPPPFAPFEGNFNRLAGQVVPAGYQEVANSQTSEVAVDRENKLRLLNAEFCTEIKGFGQIKRFPNRLFPSTQRVLVYCEVENHESESIHSGNETRFLTRLTGSYLIVDEQGRGVQQGEFPNVEDIAMNKRRDFYLFFPIAFQNLQPGSYRLELQVKDLTANQSAEVQPALEFTVE